jgi:hypothetical protein
MCVTLLLLGNGSVKNVIAGMNTHATIEEFLDLSFSTQSVSYQGK